MRAAFLTMILVLLSHGLATAADPFIRMSIETKATALPGQQVRVAVEVFVPDFFTSPPQFPLFEMPDAIVTLPADRPLNKTETRDGIQYSGIRRVYAVIPERSGTFTLPEINIPLGYSKYGRPTSVEVRSQAMSFTVAAPEDGSEAVLLSARNLTLSQAFDPDPSSIEADDALVRTVTMFAQDTQAIMLPPLDVTAPGGVRLYRKEAVLADDVPGPDHTTGSSRTETLNYVFSSPGTFELPEVSLSWFDLDAGSTAIAALDTVSVTVADAKRSGSRIAPVETQERRQQPDLRQTWTTALVVAVSVAFMAACWSARDAVKRCLAGLRDAIRNSEPVRLRYLTRSIRRDEPLRVYASLDEWAQAHGKSSISSWVTETDDADVAAQVGILERRLFGSLGSWTTSERTALELSVSRTRMIRDGVGHTRSLTVIPPLNP